ncbi:Fic/DOC family protein [Vibrio neptunius]|uniref:protein adenylyltransferase n=1 Tax=Vibrio neptunius TaxID=170651 RepID=A0ABS3A7I4_9VIBR|nr:Fic family protein [Vibrio neptunius]MBN3495498.1 Fic family protein [Vibrio neptunius]MBN3517504.1 Fic family protein [Vibrio neptunius]MBN3551841.1 Fic family protein [Vibrio neptunius]MBN3580308.1 Fic family protein [Vibrio neptunius]MCH9873974.1 Fic family protein [Vibrio neptunius]
MRDKYGVAQDHYCYPGSNTLVNLLDIRDSEKLDEAEVAFSEHRYIEYTSLISNLEDFDISHFRHLHWVLFQDVYEWAGEDRDIDISKGNTRFCHCSFIERELIKQLERIPQLRECSNRHEFIQLVADIFCEINIIHPFREGNGRATRFFFEELVFIAGYEINWPEISKEQWIEANEKGYLGDVSFLELIFDMAIS